MITLFAHHAVEDFEKWKEGYDATKEEVASFGVVEESVHREVDSGAVIVTHKFEDLETARQFQAVFATDESRERLEAMGVIPPVTMWLSEDQ